jgi:hypothetical protein
VSIVAVYRISNRITISGTWVYGTGNAVTLPVSEYMAPYHLRPRNAADPRMGVPIPEILVDDISEKNNFRMGAYHRLDAGIQLHKKKKHWERTWEFSVYNAYNRQNPFYYYQEVVSEKSELYGKLRQVSLFPVIPSFSYSIKF